MEEDSPSLRRSSRSTRKTSKFTDDAFEGIEIDLRRTDDSSEDSAGIEDAADDSDSDVVYRSVEADDVDVSDDDSLYSETTGRPLRSGLDDGGVILLPDHVVAQTLQLPLESGPRLHDSPSTESDETQDINRSRGITLTRAGEERQGLMYYLFGGEKEDCVPLSQAREKWFPEITFPSRTANSEGVGGMSESFYSARANQDERLAKEWSWYADAYAKGAFEHLQASEAQDNTSIPFSSIVTGPPYCEVITDVENGEILRIELGTSTPLEDIWPLQSSPIDEGEGEGVQFQQTEQSQRRSGWLLNIGEPAHCLEWVPNQCDEEQFLALTTTGEREHSDTTSASDNMIDDEDFMHDQNDEELEQTSAHIQIWQFWASTVTDKPSRFSKSNHPRLRHVIQTEWGTITQMQWCPVKHNVRSEIPKQRHHLGLLGVLHSDGKIRVLDVTFPKAAESEWPTLKTFIKAAFEAKPEETFCTCFAWLSSALIAVGCSNGYVAIYDLESHIRSSSSQSNPLPLMYQPLHTTSIFRIVSCEPSRPEWIVTSSADGYMRLTDLRHPSTEFCLSLRARVGFTPLVWSDHIQHIVAADDSDSVRAYCMRLFWHALLLTQEQFDITALSSSPVHPMVLIGLSDGSVTVTNPVRRLFHRRQRDSQYKQIWFTNDWKRGEDIPGDIEMNHPAKRHVVNSSARNNAINGDGDSGGERSSMHFPYGLTRLATNYEPEDMTSIVNNNADLPDPESSPESSDSSERDSQSPTYRLSETPENEERPSTQTDSPASDDAYVDDGPDPSAQLQREDSDRQESAEAEDAPSAEDEEPGMLPMTTEAPRTQTVHERETGITALAWNPNLHVGGWAAAGLGSGLLLVEDLCVD